MALLEIACFTPESAIQAWQAGADRIELCTDREAGGTTPSLESAHLVKQLVQIPVFVMIRPRGGDFNFSDAEFECMKEEIDSFKPIVDGYVLGILDERNDVDTVRTAQLVQRAQPLPCTFHRAFDESRDKLKALDDIVGTGCQTVLSSGGAMNAMEGAQLIYEMVCRAQDYIKILVGGGVRANNLVELHRYTRAHGYHSSAILAGSTELDSGEVRLMKTLLHQTPLDPAETVNVMRTAQLTLIEARQSRSRVIGDRHISAVSAGINTPIEELNRHL